MLSTRDPPQNKGHIQTEVKGWKKVFHANGDQKKAGVEKLTSDKIDFVIKTMKRDKERHYIMIKGSIQAEETTIINTYAPNIGAPQYIRQMLTRAQLDLTDIYRTFHPKTINFTFFSSAHRTFSRTDHILCHK